MQKSCGNSAEKLGKSAESIISEQGNHSTKFHIKIRKPHFKLRKALFKRGLERNGKNKKFLEFDVEKEGKIFFGLIKLIILK